MNKKNTNNKGFTLVELIVVLVILAILAAILVPALLGYIDRAREKQYVLNAKSALTAAQAELSSLYGEGKYELTTAKKTTIQNTADVPGTKFTIYTGKKLTETDVKGYTTTADKHAAYTVKAAIYEENGVYMVFYDGAWTGCQSESDAQALITDNNVKSNSISIWAPSN